MPDGKTHHKYYKSVGWPIVIVLSLFVLGWTLVVDRANAGWYLEFAFWLYPHYLSAAVCEPDLDLLGVSSSDGVMLRKLGCVGVPIFAYWAFYAAMIRYLSKTFGFGGIFGGHRSKLSHSLFPGTVIRMAFVDFPFFAGYWLFSRFAVRTFSVSFWDITIFLLAQFAALGVSDSIHIWLDKNHGE